MKSDWKKLIEKLPPMLTFSQAANMLLMPYTTVRLNLKRHGYKNRDGRNLRYVFRPAHSKVAWHDVDWTLSNVALSKKYRTSREYVRRMRNRLGKPFVESRGNKPKRVVKPKGKPLWKVFRDELKHRHD